MAQNWAEFFIGQLESLNDKSLEKELQSPKSMKIYWLARKAAKTLILEISRNYLRKCYRRVLKALDTKLKSD